MLDSHGADVLLLWCYVRIIWARRNVVVTPCTVVRQRLNTEILSKMEQQNGLD